MVRPTGRWESVEYQVSPSSLSYWAQRYNVGAIALLVQWPTFSMTLITHCLALVSSAGRNFVGNVLRSIATGLLVLTTVALRWTSTMTCLSSISMMTSQGYLRSTVSMTRLGAFFSSSFQVTARSILFRLSWTSRVSHVPLGMLCWQCGQSMQDYCGLALR